MHRGLKQAYSYRHTTKRLPSVSASSSSSAALSGSYNNKNNFLIHQQFCNKYCYDTNKNNIHIMCAATIQKKNYSNYRQFSTTSSLSSSSTPFKSWPRPMIESKGDYREEAFLEDIIGGQLYEHQKSLPRLPIPSISETIETLLPTALPLALYENEKTTFLDACKAFPAQASILHDRLHERRDGEMKDSSWLQLWWNTAGYLQVRDPVVVNVSYFFHFSDDSTLPHPTPKSKSKSLGVLRGASILYSIAEFRKLLCSGSLPCESIGRKDKQTHLCSVAFKYMFNACRVPHREQDTYRIYDPSLYQHVIVAYNGNFFSFDFVNKETGDPLPLDLIEDKLQRCIDVAREHHSNDPQLGWLTSSDRDSWADAREELLRVGGMKMESALTKLESGAIMLCLDEEVCTTL